MLEYHRVLFSVLYCFLVYINDIVEEIPSSQAKDTNSTLFATTLVSLACEDEEIQSNINSFDDDTCLSMVVGNPSAAGTILQNDIKK